MSPIKWTTISNNGLSSSPETQHYVLFANRYKIMVYDNYGGCSWYIRDLKHSINIVMYPGEELDVEQAKSQSMVAFILLFAVMLIIETKNPVKLASYMWENTKRWDDT